MTSGVQADSAENNGESEQRGSMASVTVIPNSTIGGLSKEGKAGRSRTGIPDDGSPEQGILGGDLVVVPEVQGA